MKKTVLLTMFAISMNISGIAFATETTTDIGNNTSPPKVIEQKEKFAEKQAKIKEKFAQRQEKRQARFEQRQEKRQEKRQETRQEISEKIKNLDPKDKEGARKILKQIKASKPEKVSNGSFGSAFR